jgi:hypothetical protein
MVAICSDDVRPTGIRITDLTDKVQAVRDIGTPLTSQRAKSSVRSGVSQQPGQRLRSQVLLAHREATGEVSQYVVDHADF